MQNFLAFFTSLFATIGKVIGLVQDHNEHTQGVKDAELQQDIKVLNELQKVKEIDDANSKLTLDQLRDSNRV